tara:strand:- start:1697 stop:1951 length:255 start_codon:yes stop_codon:yes gene_type:complete
MSLPYGKVLGRLVKGCEGACESLGGGVKGICRGCVGGISSRPPVVWWRLLDPHKGILSFLETDLRYIFWSDFNFLYNFLVTQTF